MLKTKSLWVLLCICWANAKSFKDFKIGKFFENESSYCIPKIIWTYWNGVVKEDVMEMVVVSRDSLKNFTFFFMSQSNISQFLDINSFPSYFPKLWQQGRADYIRLSLIAKYGGLWIDASTFVTSGVEMEALFAQAFEKRAQIFSFFFDTNIKGVRRISANFFGASENSIIMKKWKDIFEAGLLSNSLKNFVRKICKRLRVVSCVTYHFIDSSYVKIMHDNPSFQKWEVSFPKEKSNLLLESKCKYRRKCMKDRLLHVSNVRKYPFTKVFGRHRTGKKVGFYKKFA